MGALNGTQTRSRKAPIALLVLMALLLGISNNINWGREHWRTVLQADAKGYYAYLPAIFIYKDLHFVFLEEAEAQGSNPNLFYDYRTAPTGDTINKYWCGTALLQAPFFLAMHAVVSVTDGEANGYGKPYVVAICLAAIAYALLGLWALIALLESYGIAERWRMVVAFAILFGTHLFYYVIVAPGMSHVYSFALIALFFLAARRYAERPGPRPLIAMGALLGLLILVRPVNGIALLTLPFLAGSVERFKAGILALRSHAGAAVGAALLGVVIAGTQPLIWYLSTGHWWVDSYPGESFHWSDPHGLDILFSYKKGLFLYTPMCLIALAGLIPLWRSARFAAMAWLSFFVVLVYVFSSWWNWWYGGSFSARPFVEYLPLFAIPLGLVLQHFTKGLRTVYLISLALLMLLCQVQTYQARYYQIHYEDMDRERYWEVFLRVDRLP